MVVRVWRVTLFPEALDDYISADNSVRFLDAFVETLDIKALGFKNVTLKDTARPPYHPGDLLRLYIYGYLNQIRSSRMLERETHRSGVATTGTGKKRNPCGS
jgi:transposase